MKEKVIKIMLGWIENNEPIETTADKLLDLFAVSGLLPAAEELNPFLYWVFHKADRIYVEHTLGWRNDAIEELYKAWKRSIC